MANFLILITSVSSCPRVPPPPTPVSPASPCHVSAGARVAPLRGPRSVSGCASGEEEERRMMMIDDDDDGIGDKNWGRHQGPGFVSPTIFEVSTLSRLM